MGVLLGVIMVIAVMVVIVLMVTITGTMACQGQPSVAEIQPHLPEIYLETGSVAEDVGKTGEALGGNLGQSSVEPFPLGPGGLLKFLTLIHGDPGIEGIGGSTLGEGLLA